MTPEPSDILRITYEPKTIHGTLDMKTGTLKLKTIRTNADRIRAMTDERLATFLDNICNCVRSADYKWNKCVDYDECRLCWLDWLKEEVKDGCLDKA